NAVAGELGLEEVAAVDERERAANTDDAAPASFADQLAELVMAESVREDVAVGRRKLVHEADLGAHHHPVRIGPRAGIAGDVDHGDLAAEALDELWRDVAAAIAAHVDDQRLLAELRIVVAGELIEAG